ncbi:hypothetical protein HanRHA438_Chr01g0022561 [Helianthus annuus]|nr:hypothetical protein HanRHA438_Chr01g0022561 [Helianthus annuus]
MARMSGPGSGLGSVGSGHGSVNEMIWVLFSGMVQVKEQFGLRSAGSSKAVNKVSWFGSGDSVKSSRLGQLS